MFWVCIAAGAAVSAKKGQNPSAAADLCLSVCPAEKSDSNSSLKDCCRPLAFYPARSSLPAPLIVAELCAELEFTNTLITPRFLWSVCLRS